MLAMTMTVENVCDTVDRERVRDIMIEDLDWSGNNAVLKVQ